MVILYQCEKEKLIEIQSRMFTAPFSTQARSKAFLKLIHNLQFEHKVRQALPPPYRRKSESFYDCERPRFVNSAASLPSSNGDADENGDKAQIWENEAIEEAIEDEEEEWDENDRHLPSYDESEDAVERYLIDRGLLSEDGTPLMPTESHDGSTPPSPQSEHMAEIEAEESAEQSVSRATTSDDDMRARRFLRRTSTSATVTYANIRRRSSATQI